jgi:PAS domain S-box-containing protein
LLGLSKAAQAVQRARTPDEVYRAIGEQIVELGYDAVIFVLSADGTALTIPHLTFESGLLQAAERLADVSASHYRIPVQPGGFYDRLLREGRTRFVEQITAPLAESLPKMTRPLAGRILALMGLEQAIYVPMTVGDNTNSILSVIGAGLTEADVPAVTAFANQATVALDNARLYSEVRQQVEALQESQQLLESTFHSLREAVFVIDADTMQIIDCNPAASEVFGYDRDKMLGRTTAFLHVDEAALAAFREYLYAAVEERGVLDRLEFKMKRRDGTIFDTEHSVIPLEDKGGKRTGWVSVVRDTTERVKAEAELRRHREQLAALVAERTAELVASEEKYRKLFDNAQVGMFRTRLDGSVVLEVNDKVAQIVRDTRENLLQSSAIIHWADPRERAEIIESLNVHRAQTPG